MFFSLRFATLLSLALLCPLQAHTVTSLDLFPRNFNPKTKGVTVAQNTITLSSVSSVMPVIGKGVIMAAAAGATVFAYSKTKSGLIGLGLGAVTALTAIDTYKAYQLYDKQDHYKIVTIAPVGLEIFSDKGFFGTAAQTSVLLPWTTIKRIEATVHGRYYGGTAWINNTIPLKLFGSNDKHLGEIDIFNFPMDVNDFLTLLGNYQQHILNKKFA